MRSKVTKSDAYLDDYIVDYPNSPQDLTKLMATYHESGPPVPVLEPSGHVGLCQINFKLSLRGNNKMLDNGRPSSSQSSQAQGALPTFASSCFSHHKPRRNIFQA